MEEEEEEEKDQQPYDPRRTRFVRTYDEYDDDEIQRYLVEQQGGHDDEPLPRPTTISFATDTAAAAAASKQPKRPGIQNPSRPWHMNNESIVSRLEEPMGRPCELRDQIVHEMNQLESIASLMTAIKLVVDREKTILHNPQAYSTTVEKQSRVYLDTLKEYDDVCQEYNKKREQILELMERCGFDPSKSSWFLFGRPRAKPKTIRKVRYILRLLNLI